ncbi:MAG: tetratricopeptide repeat protein, partial [Ignavibacteria bacterium]|nr:tetratricopeptide repeat protein [Ignavibacteria bacterium]
NNEGVELYKQKKYSDSEVNFRKALEKESNPITVFNLGDAYFKQKKYEDAIKSYQDVISKTDDRNLKAKSYYNIGNSNLLSNKLTESIEAYKNSLKINPKDEDAKYNLSYAMRLLQMQKQNQQKNEQKKDQKQNQDQQKNQNEQQKQDKQSKDEQKQAQQKQQREVKISKEEAEKILNALKSNEKDLQKKLRKVAGVKVKVAKDW